jgi:SAM-dependent methyltransferase
MPAAVETEWSPPLAESKVRSESGGELEWELVDCLLCGGNDFEPLVESPDFTTNRGGTFTVVRCRDCGLAFTNPRPTPRCIGRFYPPGYGPHEGHEWSDTWAARLKRRFERAVLRTSFGYPPQPATATDRLMSLVGRTMIRGRRRRAAWIPFRGGGRLLDFGCGAARFGRLMREYGWRVEGVEVSADVAARTEHTAGFPVHVGSLPHIDVRPESFDVVTMWASLEHVHDPRSVVAGAYDVLRHDGMLLVYVPNLSSWAARQFGAAWWGLELPRHLIHFTPGTLSDLLCREGFRITRLQQIGRDGWLRRSARRSLSLGRVPAASAACRWKPAALAVSRWSEWADQAESVLVWAEKA